MADGDGLDDGDGLAAVKKKRHDHNGAQRKWHAVGHGIFGKAMPRKVLQWQFIPM